MNNVWLEITKEALTTLIGKSAAAIPGAKLRREVAKLSAERSLEFPPPDMGKFSTFLERFSSEFIVRRQPGSDFIVVPVDRPEQHLPAQRRADSQVYLFRNHTGNYQPRVTGNVTSRNYVVKARASKDALDDREALASCRQGLEMLSEKVWRWLASHDLGVLNLQLAGVGAEPGLRNLCDALRKRLDDAANFNHANKPSLLTAYGRILGIPAVNLVWTYLNKGTHEEANRDDFDANLVEDVVRTLEEIDALDLRAGR